MTRPSFIKQSYIAAVAAGAAAMVACVPSRPGTAWPAPASQAVAWWEIWAVLAVLLLACDLMPVPLSARRAAWTPGATATLAAVVLLGPAGAGLTGAAAALSLRRMPLGARVFGGAAQALAGCAAGCAYVVAGGLAGIGPAALFPALTSRWPGVAVAAGFAPLTGPFAAGAIVAVLVSHGLNWQLTRHFAEPGADGLVLDGLVPVQSAAAQHAVTDLGLAALGLVIAALWAVIGPFAAAILLVPLYVARWAMLQIADQRRAHAATLAAFCQAVETKDVLTRGHSERVARNAAMIARQIAMRPDRAEAVAFAGLLHDVGKLGVPTRVLRKPGPLTDDERAAMQLHPWLGLEITRHIKFLDEALTGVMHHHERVDGRGYPMGLAGEEIPEFARIIGVADAFDAMTSDRPYRRALSERAAVAALRDGAGSAFDPPIVEAFLAARAGSEPPDPAPPA